MIKTVLYKTIETPWKWGFRISGALGTSPQRITFSDGRAKVLIVAPHPDDETIGAGGAAMRHIAAGHRVTAAILTDGRNSRALGLSEDRMITTRRAEAQQAAEILGVQLILANLPEMRWSHKTACDFLRPLITTADIIYTPSCIDFHPEHRRTAMVVADLIADHQTVRIMELGVPLTAILANRLADFPAYHERKGQALAAYKTQQGALSALSRIGRYRAARYGHVAAEVFCELDGRRFGKLMKVAMNTPRIEGAFYGIRPRPVSDPLAWWKGRALRRKLLAAAIS